jgi:hypothetical protein
VADDDVWNEVHPVVADEIHRLRDICRRQQDEIERLRAENARLASFLHPIGEEARRG